MSRANRSSIFPPVGASSISNRRRAKPRYSGIGRDLDEEGKRPRRQSGATAGGNGGEPGELLVAATRGEDVRRDLVQLATQLLQLGARLVQRRLRLGPR